MDLDDDSAGEERAIYAIITAACAPIAIGVAITHGALDGGNTLAIILGLTASAGLAAGIRSRFRRRLPIARTVRR